MQNLRCIEYVLCECFEVKCKGYFSFIYFKEMRQIPSTTKVKANFQNLIKRPRVGIKYYSKIIKINHEREKQRGVITPTIIIMKRTSYMATCINNRPFQYKYGAQLGSICKPRKPPPPLTFLTY